MKARSLGVLAVFVVLALLASLTWREIRQATARGEESQDLEPSPPEVVDPGATEGWVPPAAGETAREEVAVDGVPGNFGASITLTPEWLQGEGLTKVTAQLQSVESGAWLEVEFTDSTWSGDLSGAHRIREIRRGSDVFAFESRRAVSAERPEARVHIRGVRTFLVRPYDLDTGAIVAGAEVSAPQGGDVRAVSGPTGVGQDGTPVDVPPGALRLSIAGTHLPRHLVLKAPGYCDFHFERAPFARELRIPLRRAASLLVTVIAKDVAPDALEDFIVEAIPRDQIRSPIGDAIEGDSLTTRPGTELTLQPGAYDVVLSRRHPQKGDQVPIAERRIELAPGSRHSIEFAVTGGESLPTLLSVHLSGMELVGESVEQYSLGFSRATEEGEWRPIPSSGADWEESTPNRTYMCEYRNVSPGRYRVTLYPFGLQQEFQLDPGERESVDFQLARPCQVQIDHGGDGVPAGTCIVLMGFDGQTNAFGSPALTHGSPVILELLERPTWIRGVADEATTPRYRIFPRPDQLTSVTLGWEPRPSTSLELAVEPIDVPLDDSFWSQVRIEESRGPGTSLSRSILSGDGRPNYEGQIASRASCLLSDPGHYRIEHPTLRGEMRVVYTDVSGGAGVATLVLD